MANLQKLIDLNGLNYFLKQIKAKFVHSVNGVKPDSKGNVNVANMMGASDSAAGKAGLAPAPAAGMQNKFLCADATWKDTFFVPDYSNPVELTKDVYNTMTYDGWLMPWVQRLSNNAGTLTINIDEATIQLSANNFSIDTNFFPVKKGSVVKFVINGSVGYLKFYRKKVN